MRIEQSNETCGWGSGAAARWPVIILACLWMGLVAGCQSSDAIGPRPARNLETVVEAYLQQYQPGTLPRLYQTTYIYDRNGELIAEFLPEGRRTWAPLAQISPYLIQATIATEDATFYDNAGIDPQRVVGAFLQNMEAGNVVSGASTITMQLARNLFLGPDKRYDASIDRKILEVGLAQELTKLYSKGEILEMYLNLLNYGNLAYGPEAAAQVYFQKSAADLTLAEATLLAGIPQQPANFNPFENFEDVRQRQLTVLDLMVRHGYLTEQEARAVHAQQFALRNHFASTENTSYRPVNRAPHFARYIVEQLDSQPGAGYTMRSGFHIFTTLDLEMQELAQQIVQEQVAALQPRYDLSNAALVALKPGDAEILTMVGSADYYNDDISGQLNITLRPRQPGSAVKPLYYAVAFDEEQISPRTVLWDLPVRYPVDETETYQPRNYDREYHGPMTVRTALANSYNVPVVKLFDAMGVNSMLVRARDMGLWSLDRDNAWYGLSMALGTGEVTLLELSSAYHVLLNDGRYTPPRAILNIMDSRGQPVDIQGPVEPRQVISPEAAFLVTDILSDNQARIPEFGPNSVLNLSRPAAAKTGTTTDWRDSWTLGYTRYLVSGVWSGNSDGRATQGSTGIRGAAPIWNAFMEAVIANPSLLNKLDAPAAAESWEFIPPPRVVQQEISCPEGVRCADDAEYFTTGWLNKTRHSDPLFDSAATGLLTEVYADSGGGERWVGYCMYASPDRKNTSSKAAPAGPQRTLLSIPQGVGLMEFLDGELARKERLTEWEFSLLEARQDRLQQESDQALDWSRRTSVPLTFGYCETAESSVRHLLGDSVQTVSVPGLPQLAQSTAANGVAQTDPPVPVPEASSAPEPTAVPAPAPEDAARPAPEENAPAGNVFAVESAWSDASCAGNYILGQVLNRAGEPVAGVRLVAVDQWGNRAEAVSKSSNTDYGRFDFPLYNPTPHEVYVSVVDAAGNLISPSVTVAHRMEDTSARCHHIVFMGGE